MCGRDTFKLSVAEVLINTLDLTQTWLCFVPNDLFCVRQIFKHCIVRSSEQKAQLPSIASLPTHLEKKKKT